jgi:hypothetical protein
VSALVDMHIVVRHLTGDPVKLGCRADLVPAHPDLGPHCRPIASFDRPI